jgi:hypothetical protein
MVHPQRGALAAAKPSDNHTMNTQVAKESEDSPLVEAARQWVVKHYVYNRRHLLGALEWLDRIAPDADEAVRLAALTHDMERAFPGPDQPALTSLIDPEYEKAHSTRSARIVCAWLREQSADETLIAKVERLIVAHEFGGWPEADLVQAVDSLSFLETNIDLFLGFVRSGRFSAYDVRQKFNHSYERIGPTHLKALAAPLVEAARARLTALEAELPTPSA